MGAGGADAVSFGAGAVTSGPDAGTSGAALVAVASAGPPRRRLGRGLDAGSLVVDSFIAFTFGACAAVAGD